MIRAHLLVGAGTVVVALGCTAFVAAELSGQQASDGGNTEDSGASDAGLGGCFNLTNNQCGQCIAQACEMPNGSPPVSLAQVCMFPESELPQTVANCTSNPDIMSFDCQSSYIEGGAYSPTISSQGAAENNVQKCIFDNCLTSCSQCNVPVPSCGGSTVTLAEAGACGQCLNNAQNVPNAPCQTWVLQGACVEDSDNPASSCAVTAATCGQQDCSGLSSPSSDLDDAGYAFATCLWQHCQGSCQ
jgi:hypothetical protein